MRILGTVLHISSHKNLIISGDVKNKKKMNLPKINSIVFDWKMNRIGKINDVIGPLSGPYFSVRISKDITDGKLANLKNKHIYVK